MHVVALAALPDSALAAAAQFYADILPQLPALFAQHDALALQLPAAPADHDDWRRSCARDIARAHAPARFNIIGGGDAEAVQASLAYLAGAAGVTGQYLKLHPAG